MNQNLPRCLVNCPQAAAFGASERKYISNISYMYRHSINWSRKEIQTYTKNYQNLEKAYKQVQKKSWYNPTKMTMGGNNSIGPYIYIYGQQIQ